MSEFEKNSKIEIVTIDREYLKNREKIRESDQEKNEESVAPSMSQKLVPVPFVSVPQRNSLEMSNKPNVLQEQNQHENYSQSPPNYYPAYNEEVALSLHLLQQAGLRLSQAQSLNYLIIRNQIELQKQYEGQRMDFYHAIAMQNLKNNFQPVAEPTISMSTNTFSAEELDRFNDEFKMETKAVKIRSSDTRSGWIYMLREDSINRHVEFGENQLVGIFKEWLYLKIGERIDDIPSKTMERTMIKLKRKISELYSSNLTVLQENNLRFNNGIYDLQTDQFYICPPSANIFNEFSILVAYEETAESTVFDELLDDITDCDENIKRLIYEIIGAVITNTTLLKRIFVFQGVSNGGKTRLMKIIARLLCEIDVAFVNTVSEVTSDQFKNLINSKHLICVNDSADKKLASVQTSYLKSFADGNINNNGNATKLIVATNYAITSGNNGFVEPALINRLLIVPFKKAMDNSNEDVEHFEDDFFEKEKLGIICKSLKAFGEVFRNGRKFCCNPILNDPELLSTYETKPVTSFNDTERKTIAEIKSQGGNFSSTLKMKLYKIFDEIYTVTENCNFDMTIDTIANAIKKIDSALISNPNQLGKDLKIHFGEKLKTERIAGQMIYNLKFKENDEK